MQSFPSHQIHSQRHRRAHSPHWRPIFGMVWASCLNQMEMDLANPGYSSGQNLYGRWAGLASWLIKTWPPSGCAPFLDAWLPLPSPFMKIGGSHSTTWGSLGRGQFGRRKEESSSVHVISHFEHPVLRGGMWRISKRMLRRWDSCRKRGQWCHRHSKQEWCEEGEWNTAVASKTWGQRSGHWTWWHGGFDEWIWNEYEGG